MVELVVTVGLPASGKDTYYNSVLKDMGYIHVSSDNIRTEIFGDVNDQKHNAEVFDIMMKRVKEALREGKSCCYNATNLNAKRRMNFIKEIKAAQIANIKYSCAMFIVPFEVCKARNAARDRVVPEYVMERMYKSFQAPCYAEGWDEIRNAYAQDCDLLSVFDMVCHLREVSHNNPHHSATIGDHMVFAAEYAKEHHMPMSVVEAASIHDIGKSYCKVFHNMKGEPCDYAHYYGHNCVSVYLYLQHRKMNVIDKYTDEVSALICYHMEHYAGEARIKNLEKIFNKNFMEKLKMLNEADRNSH